MPPPVEVVGHWSTVATKYKDRIFEIREDAILFDLGEYAPTIRHSLVNVESEEDPSGRKKLTFQYLEEDGSMGDLVVTYWASPRPELRFENRQEKWTRRGPRGGSRVRS